MQKSRPTLSSSQDVCAIVIGRNEGPRLDICIRSLSECHPIIYVDSGSSDDSIAVARASGAEIVELDMSIPFTAARARNAGFQKLQELESDPPYLQFVDGDCEMVAGWVPSALAFLEANRDVAVVCGQRIERVPGFSVYNAMCDHEWNTLPGITISCGGDAMMRTEIFEAMGGYAAQLIAHEEPELCARIRRSGRTIFRLDRAMTFHDAAIGTISQFYRRNRRAGLGISQCLYMQGSISRELGSAILLRALFWAAAIPVFILLLGLLFGWIGALGLLVYPAQIIRHALADQQGVAGSFGHRLRAAWSAMVGKFAEAHGCLEFMTKSAFRKPISPVLYKQQS